MNKTERGKECYFKVALSQSKKLNPHTKVKDGRNERDWWRDSKGEGEKDRQQVLVCNKLRDVCTVHT